jgi:hypothetical protein
LAQRQPVARPAAAPRALHQGSFRAQIDPGANHPGRVR